MEFIFRQVMGSDILSLPSIRHCSEWTNTMKRYEVKMKLWRMFSVQEITDKVMQGDCLQLMAALPDKCIDMVLCDLPYQVTQNQWDLLVDLDALWVQYNRVVKDNAAIILSSQGLFTGRLIMSNPGLFRYKMVWIKSRATNFLNKAIQPLRKHEDLCVFYKQQPVYHPQRSPGKAYNKGIRKPHATGNYGTFGASPIKSDGPRYPHDVLLFEEMEDFVYVRTVEHESAYTYHSVQKPVALGRYLVRTFSNPGDLVLDNTCGSGSFLVAARMEGRRYLGMEKNEGVRVGGKPVDLISICRRRLDAVQGGLAF